MPHARRVAINTGYLYIKMLITMIISLYSTRLVLLALGVTDYGIFSLVGGVIAMLSFLNGAMATATQRYMSFSIGAGDFHKLESIFSSSVILHLIIGFVIVILLEIGGLFLFDGALNIPIERIVVAKLVFHFMVVSTFFTINSVPFDASISAHENFLFDAILGICESIFKLLIALSLVHSNFDKLVQYGFLTAALTIIIRIIKSIYCYRMYSECRFPKKSLINVELTKEMFSFASWNLFGSLCAVVRSQGIAIVLNMFFGVIVNAAYGIASQVNGQLSSFSINMLNALTPQIVKSEGGGDRDRMLRLSMLACKLSFFLLSFFAIPLIVEMPFVLKIWLKTVPENTIIFCRLFLVLSLLQQLSAGLMASITAVGNIKAYQVAVGSLLILNLPLSYGLLLIGFPVYSVLIGSIFLEFIALNARIWFANKLVRLPVTVFFEKVLFKSVISVILVFLFALTPQIIFLESILRVVFTIFISSILLIIVGKYIALSQYENEKISSLIVALMRNLNSFK